jgi:hypothetical protein
MNGLIPVLPLVCSKCADQQPADPSLGPSREIDDEQDEQNDDQNANQSVTGSSNG